MMGAFRHDRHGERENEPQLTGVPCAPEWLDAVGRELWERLVPQLTSSGIAKAADTESLAALCEWWSTWRTAHAAIATSENKHVAINQSAKAWQQFSTLASKFGLSPVDRTKIAVEPKDDNKETEKRYFA